MDMKTAHIIEEKERTKDIAIEENVTFEEMYLSDAVLSGLNGCGFIRPSPIQLSAIPLGRCGLDLIVQAKSGTGKTIVFTVVALEMISVKAPTTQVLVIAPTREIAVQIGLVINSVGAYFKGLKASTFIGGINLQEDKSKLKCCHIAVGTPGRLIQLVKLGYLNLSNVRLLVLDEADQLLQGQFKENILELVKTLPFNKQILALSATYPNEVTEFLDQYMRSPSHVRLGRDSPALIGVNQFVRLLPDHPQSHMRHKYKFNELLYIISSVTFNQCLVFSNSQLRAESICNQLKSSGWPASYLSGGQIQSERLQSFYALCSYKCRILVSTDLSARGLDSEHANLVINLDVPMDQATYLHRVGRAGRFGSIGTAISLVCEGEEWEAMRAVATLTNINIKVLPTEFDSSAVKSDFNNLEIVQHLDEEACLKYLQKQMEWKNKQKSYKNNNINSVSHCKKQKETVKDKMNNFQPEEVQTKEKSCSTKNSVNKKVVKNENEVEFKTIKSALNDFTNKSKFYEFTFDDVFGKISEKWENISKDDRVTLSSTSIVKECPEPEVFKNIEKYIAQREREVSMSEKNEIKPRENIKLELLEDSLSKFCSLDKIKDEDKSQILINENKLNSNNDISVTDNEESSCKEDIDHKIISDSIESLHINNGLDKSSTNNIETEDLSPEIQARLNSHEVECQVELDKEKKSCSNVGKKLSPLTKKKEYLLNTGYGEWETVPKKISSSKNKGSYKRSNLCEYDNQFNSNSHSRRFDYSSKDYYLYDHNYGNDKADYNEKARTIMKKESFPKLELHENCYSYHHNIDAYVRSAQKYAVMMNYVRTIGRMSSWIACDSHMKLIRSFRK